MKSKQWLILLVVIMTYSFIISVVYSQTEIHTIEYDGIHFEYPDILATGIQIQEIAEVPFDPETMWTATYPQHIRVTFMNDDIENNFLLPVFPAEPQILIYRTDTFAPYGGVSPYGFPEQFNALNEILQTRPDLSAWENASARPPDEFLPFLPWVNAHQVLRSQAEYLELAGGSGVRYITWYSQDASHILEEQMFYTFQGILNDGEYYVSAIFPVRTGILPDVDVSTVDWTTFSMNYDNYLADTFTEINRVPDEAFQPSLIVLDTLVQSIMLASIQ